MTETITIPIREVGGEKWCSLEHMGIKSISVVAYKVKQQNDQFSFAGGHRVRLVKFWDNIHFQVPAGTTLDIAAVKPAAAAPRRQQGRR